MQSGSDVCPWNVPLEGQAKRGNINKLFPVSPSTHGEGTGRNQQCTWTRKAIVYQVYLPNLSLPHRKVMK